MSLAVLVAHAYFGKFALDTSSSILSIFLWIQASLTTNTIYVSHISRWLWLLLLHIAIIISFSQFCILSRMMQPKGRKAINDRMTKSIFDDPRKYKEWYSIRKKSFMDVLSQLRVAGLPGIKAMSLLERLACFSCHYHWRSCPESC